MSEVRDVDWVIDIGQKIAKAVDEGMRCQKINKL